MSHRGLQRLVLAVHVAVEDTVEPLHRLLASGGWRKRNWKRRSGFALGTFEDFGFKLEGSTSGFCCLAKLAWRFSSACTTAKQCEDATPHGSNAILPTGPKRLETFSADSVLFGVGTLFWVGVLRKAGRQPTIFWGGPTLEKAHLPIAQHEIHEVSFQRALVWGHDHGEAMRPHCRQSKPTGAVEGHKTDQMQKKTLDRESGRYVPRAVLMDLEP